MRKYLKWGAVILVLAILIALNLAPAIGRITGNVSAASLAPGEPARSEIYIRNAANSPAPGGCDSCPFLNGGGSSTGGIPSCH